MTKSGGVRRAAPKGRCSAMVLASAVAGLLAAASAVLPAEPAHAQFRDGFGAPPAPLGSRPSPGDPRRSDPAGRRVATEADFLLHAGEGQLQQGQLERARTIFLELLALYPGEPAADSARGHLARMERQGTGSERLPQANPLRDAATDQAIAPDRGSRASRRLRALDQDFRATVGDRVFFGESSAEIGTKARIVLAAQAEWLLRNPSLAITVEAHADERGSADFNRDIAERRGEAVRQRLVEAGVPADRIRVRAFGRDRPVAPCQADGCAAQNRRVLTVLSEGPAAPLRQGDAADHARRN